MGTKSKAKAASDTTPIPQGAAADELTASCPDLEQWPRSWMYEERDLSHGQQMVECFKPFLRLHVSVNNRLHMHGIVVATMESRLKNVKVPLDLYFSQCL